ncbi:MAG: hypothetical protein JW874_14990 [Spirochaetales bacterium]|nr:hypothetical protein [Spirochaetales bacterium]
MTATARIAATDGYNILSEIRDIYNDFFNKSYLSGIIEELPVDKSKMHSLYHLLNTAYFSSEDTKPLAEAVIYLDYFIAVMSNYLLPDLKDYLRISGFFPDMKRGSVEYVLKSFICYTFPTNLEKLKDLTDELKQVNRRLIA